MAFLQYLLRSPGGEQRYKQNETLRIKIHWVVCSGSRAECLKKEVSGNSSESIQLLETTYKYLELLIQFPCITNNILKLV